MKKILTFILVSFFLIHAPAFTQIKSNRDLIGKWQGTKISVEFFSNLKLSLTVPGGRLPVATYSADFMKNPVELKIILTDHGQTIIYKGLLEFVDNETIRLKYFDENQNGEAFRMVTLKKSR